MGGRLKSVDGRGGRVIPVIFLCAAVGAFSGATDPAARFKDIGHRMMCICGCAQILLECNHVGCPSSDEMRAELMTAVARGDSDSLVEQAFQQKYGPTVLAAPPNTGFNRTVWLMPFFVLFAGFALVAWLVRIWKDRPAPALADGIGPAGRGDLDNFRDQISRETDL